MAGLSLVGREAELAALLGRLADASQGVGGVALVAGEPGIGKTRLLVELANRARASGWTVLSGRAYDTKGMPPDLPFVEALRDYVRETPTPWDSRRSRCWAGGRPSRTSLAAAGWWRATGGVARRSFGAADHRCTAVALRHAFVIDAGARVTTDHKSASAIGPKTSSESTPFDCGTSWVSRHRTAPFTRQLLALGIITTSHPPPHGRPETLHPAARPGRAWWHELPIRWPAPRRALASPEWVILPMSRCLRPRIVRPVSTSGPAAAPQTNHHRPRLHERRQPCRSAGSAGSRRNLTMSCSGVQALAVAVCAA